MPFDLSAEKHVYFGEVFFKNIVGIFDLGSFMVPMKLGLAKSKHAQKGVEFFWKEAPEPEPDPIDPDPQPDPEPQPVPPIPDEEGGEEAYDDSQRIEWIWVVTAVLIFSMIGPLIVYFCCKGQKKESKKDKHRNSMVYFNQRRQMIEADSLGY